MSNYDIALKGFDLQGAFALDGRYQQADNTSRDAIPPAVRHEGLEVFVQDTGKKYILVGGIENSNWEESGGGGGIDVSGADGDALFYKEDGENSGWVALAAPINYDDYDTPTTASTPETLTSITASKTDLWIKRANGSHTLEVGIAEAGTDNPFAVFNTHDATVPSLQVTRANKINGKTDGGTVKEFFANGVLSVDKWSTANTTITPGVDTSLAGINTITSDQVITEKSNAYKSRIFSGTKTTASLEDTLLELIPTVTDDEDHNASTYSGLKVSPVLTGQVGEFNSFDASEGNLRLENGSVILGDPVANRGKSLISAKNNNDLDYFLHLETQGGAEAGIIDKEGLLGFRSIESSNGVKANNIQAITRTVGSIRKVQNTSELSQYAFLGELIRTKDTVSAIWDYELSGASIAGKLYVRFGEMIKADGSTEIKGSSLHEIKEGTLDDNALVPNFVVMLSADKLSMFVYMQLKKEGIGCDFNVSVYEDQSRDSNFKVGLSEINTSITHDLGGIQGFTNILTENITGGIAHWSLDTQNNITNANSGNVNIVNDLDLNGHVVWSYDSDNTETTLELVDNSNPLLHITEFGNIGIHTNTPVSGENTSIGKKTGITNLVRVGTQAGNIGQALMWDEPEGADPINAYKPKTLINSEFLDLNTVGNINARVYEETLNLSAEIGQLTLITDTLPPATDFDKFEIKLTAPTHNTIEHDLIIVSTATDKPIYLVPDSGDTISGNGKFLLTLGTFATLKYSKSTNNWYIKTTTDTKRPVIQIDSNTSVDTTFKSGSILSVGSDSEITLPDPAILPTGYSILVYNKDGSEIEVVDHLGVRTYLYTIKDSVEFLSDGSIFVPVSTGRKFDAEYDIPAVTPGEAVWDIGVSSAARLLMDEDKTLDIENEQNGTIGIIRVVQDSTGSHELTLPAGSKTFGKVSINPVADSITILSFYYDGTNFNWTATSQAGLNYSIGDLVDVSTVDAADGDILKFNSGIWTAGALSASEVTVTAHVDGGITDGDVQGTLEAISERVQSIEDNPAVDPSAASEVSFAPVENKIVATDVQAAIEEVDESWRGHATAEAPHLDATEQATLASLKETKLNTIYVDPINGDDAKASLYEIYPYKTIASALTNATAAQDVVVCLPGDYEYDTPGERWIKLGVPMHFESGARILIKDNDVDSIPFVVDEDSDGDVVITGHMKYYATDLFGDAVVPTYGGSGQISINPPAGRTYNVNIEFDTAVTDYRFIRIDGVAGNFGTISIKGKHTHVISDDSSVYLRAISTRSVSVEIEHAKVLDESRDSAWDAMSAVDINSTTADPGGTSFDIKINHLEIVSSATDTLGANGLALNYDGSNAENDVIRFDVNKVTIKNNGTGYISAIRAQRTNGGIDSRMVVLELLGENTRVISRYGDFSSHGDTDIKLTRCYSEDTIAYWSNVLEDTNFKFDFGETIVNPNTTKAAVVLHNNDTVGYGSIELSGRIKNSDGSAIDFTGLAFKKIVVRDLELETSVGEDSMKSDNLTSVRVLGPLTYNSDNLTNIYLQKKYWDLPEIVKRYNNNPSIVNGVLTVDFLGMTDVWVQNENGSAIDVGEDIIVSYFQDTDKELAYIHLNVTGVEGDTHTVSFLDDPLVSNDSRLAEKVLTLTPGLYILRLLFNSSGTQLEVLPNSASSTARYGINYLYSDDTTDSDPGSNNFKFNSTDLSAVTWVNFSKVMQGINIDSLISELIEGSEVIAYHSDDQSKFISAVVSAAPIVETNYVHVPLTVSDFGNDFEDGDDCSTNFDFESSGGSTIEQNEVPFISRDAFNINTSNNESVITDEIGVRTTYDPKIRASTDYDASNEAAGTLIERNSTNTGFKAVKTKYDDRLRVVPMYLSADGDTGFSLPADFSIFGIGVEADGDVVQETLSLGTGDGLSDIAQYEVSANFNGVIPIKSRYFSAVEATNVWLAGLTTGTIVVHFLIAKGRISDISSDASNVGRNVVNPTATNSLDIDFGNKPEVLAIASGGGGIFVDEDITLVTYSNSASKQFAYIYLDIQTSPRSITFGTNFYSSDSRVSNGVATLPVGAYLARLSFDGSNNDQIEILPGEAASSGSGLETKENDLSIGSQPARNLITNGAKQVFVEDSGEGEIVETAYFEVGVDVDPTGKNDGDLWGYNAASEKTVPNATKPFDESLRNPEAVNATGLLSTILLAGYKLTALVIENNGDDPQLIDIGYPTAGDQNIVASQSIVAGYNEVPLATSTGIFASAVNDTDIYLDSDGTTLGLVLYYKFDKII